MNTQKQNKPQTEEKALSVQEGGIVMPAVSPKEAVEAWAEYQTLKKQIMTPEDVQKIQGKEFLKKSYWRKIATFFNLSVEITAETHEALTENNIYWNFTCKATAPNGRYAYGVGSCDQMEKGRRNTIHNTRGTAETRAFNRAVANLVGGGEVSAEEMVPDEEYNQPQRPQNTYRSAPVVQDDGLVHELTEDGAAPSTGANDGGVDYFHHLSDNDLKRDIAQLMTKGKIEKNFAGLNKMNRVELIALLQKAA